MAFKQYQVMHETGGFEISKLATKTLQITQVKMSFTLHM